MEPICNRLLTDIMGHWGITLPTWAIVGFALVAALIGTYAFISLNAMFLIWLERKISGRVQRRQGPMICGPKKMAQKSMWLGGWIQTACDSGKLLFKEDIVPTKVDKLGFTLAPILVMVAAIAVYVPIPWSATLYGQTERVTLAIADLNVGLLYIIAVPSLTAFSIILAGWSSNNKYSLLGGFRSVVQMLSYEIPMMFALLGPVVLAGSLSLGDIVKAQTQGFLGIPFLGWFIVPSFIGACVYFICAIAESNRPPFDMPESEQELGTGFSSEYSGMRFAMFYLAEFSNAFIVSSIFTAIFLGGWSIPGFTPPAQLDLGFFVLPYFDLLFGILVFCVKAYFVVLILMWIRWTFIRIRPDHLMNFGWKFLLPLSFANLIICTVIAAVQQIYFGGLS